MLLRSRPSFDLFLRLFHKRGDAGFVYLPPSANYFITFDGFVKDRDSRLLSRVHGEVRHQMVNAVIDRKLTQTI